MEESSEESNENTTLIRPRTEQRRVYPTWECPICGTCTWVTNKKRHLSTRKHKDVLYITTERFEML